MKVNLNIEEDDQFRAHVKSLIEGQVRHVLREQMQGIVAGEIAKMRLMQPGSTTLSEMITKEVARITGGTISTSNVHTEMKNQIQAALRPHIINIAAESKQQIADAVVRVLRS